MRALMAKKYGKASDVLEIQEINKPAENANQILIKVGAASINPVDYKIYQGDFKAIKKRTFPFQVGYDVSGEIVSVGANVTGFKVGDSVFSRNSEETIGTIAEYVVTNTQDVSFKPENISHQQAASIPLVALTAYQALFDTASIKSGDKILIHAGAGGVGTVAIQLAKHFGAYIATTTSTKNVQFLTDLGADLVIDYTKQNYLEIIKDYDIVFDTLGGEHTQKAFELIKEKGKVVTIVGPVDNITAKQLDLNIVLRILLSFKARSIVKLAKQKNALFRMVLMVSNGKQLSKIANLMASNTIRPVIDKVYPFDQSIEAFEYLEKGRARGKVVISFEYPPIS